MQVAQDAEKCPAQPPEGSAVRQRLMSSIDSFDNLCVERRELTTLAERILTSLRTAGVDLGDDERGATSAWLANDQAGPLASARASSGPKAGSHSALTCTAARGCRALFARSRSKLGVGIVAPDGSTPTRIAA